MGKKEISIVRSSVAEYLTFITANGKDDVNAIYFDENVWLSQKMMSVLYDVEVHTINYHLKKIFADGELDENAVIRNFRITASDGKNYLSQDKLYQSDFDKVLLSEAETVALIEDGES